MWIWGGARYSAMGNTMTALGDGASFDPSTLTWTPKPVQNAPTPRYDHVVAWTGREAIIYGGSGTDKAPLADVYRFGP